MTKPSKFSVLPFQPNPEDEGLMRLAIEQAVLGGQQGEVPIGALVAQGGEVLAMAHNAPVSLNNPCAHAEIRAIEQACARVGNYRLGSAATLYVTLQPCLMCLGAILHARIGRVVVGQSQSRFNHGLADSLRCFELAEAWHGCRFEEGCLPEVCSEPLNAFFQNKRQSREVRLMAVKCLADLPNVNKETVALLSDLGYGCGADFLTPSVEGHVERLSALALSLKSEVNHQQQAAILYSLCEYLKGEPVRSWRCFL